MQSHPFRAMICRMGFSDLALQQFYVTFEFPLRYSLSGQSVPNRAKMSAQSQKLDSPRPHHVCYVALAHTFPGSLTRSRIAVHEYRVRSNCEKLCLLARSLSADGAFFPRGGHLFLPYRHVSTFGRTDYGPTLLEIWNLFSHSVHQNCHRGGIVQIMASHFYSLEANLVILILTRGL